MTAQPSSTETDDAPLLAINAPARSKQRVVLDTALPPAPRADRRDPTAALAVHLDRFARRVTVRGELDIATVPVLTDVMAWLLDIHPGDTTIDIYRLNFIDAAGIGCLVAHSRLLAAIGAKISIVGATPRMRRTFGIVGLGDLLETS